MNKMKKKTNKLKKNRPIKKRKYNNKRNKLNKNKETQLINSLKMKKILLMQYQFK
jgi:hypothetical protein